MQQKLVSIKTRENANRWKVIGKNHIRIRAKSNKDQAKTPAQALALAPAQILSIPFQMTEI